jgi:nucleotide-binding universal stress UspA family protein
VHTALRLARDHEEDTELVLLRVVRLPGSAYRSGHLATEALVERATEGLRPLVQMVEGAGAAAVPLAIPGSPGETVVRVANERDPDLVLLGWRRSLFGRHLLGGVVGDVLRGAKADVAVLVDPSHQGLRLDRGARIAVPFGGGFHEEVAAQAYESSGVWTVAAPVAGDVTDRLHEEAREADLVVMGVSDSWSRDQHSLGELRGSVAARASAPVLIVRRHGQPGQRGPGRWLRRQQEWMDEPSAAEEAADALTG